MSTESKYYDYNPEKRNIFIEMYGGRTNHFLNFIGGFFMMFASSASSIIEVFLRKRFGERYITLSQSILLFFIILFSSSFIRATLRQREGGTLLIIFAFVYLILSIRHRLEIKKYGTAYDFKRFSLSNGEIAEFWYDIIGKKVLGIRITTHLVHILLEPAVPVIIGLLFMISEYTRPLGFLLYFCGVVFGIRNFSIANKGRNWVLDNIDKKISNEMKYDVFIGRKPKKDTKGVYMPIELPDDLETREALYKAIDMASTETEDIWLSDNLDDPIEKGRERDGLTDDNGGSEGGGLADKGDKGNGVNNGVNEDDSGNGVGNGLDDDSSGVGNG
ncbi:MAG: hypothetical protein AAFX55_18510 [Bacteroidota bacterium]